MRFFDLFTFTHLISQHSNSTLTLKTISTTLLCCLKMVPVSKPKGLISVRISFKRNTFWSAIIGSKIVIYKLVLLIPRDQESLSVAWPCVRRRFQDVWRFSSCYRWEWNAPLPDAMLGQLPPTTADVTFRVGKRTKGWRHYLQ